MDSNYPPTGPMTPDGPKVVPAATIIILRKGSEADTPEFLMVQRAKEMRFAGGAAVFPGGRIDPSDRELALRLAPDDDHEIISAKIGGIRETLEETGLMIATRQSISIEQAASARAMLLETEDLAPVLDHFGWQLDLDSVVY
ncbi:MAG: NUDIX hydrolase, partial [Sphingomonadaceae bacterium]|nr:NUDIX hydrolase [Sphingomonadaceae bacterium]